MNAKEAAQKCHSDYRIAARLAEKGGYWRGIDPGIKTDDNGNWVESDIGDKFRKLGLGSLLH